MEWEGLKNISLSIHYQSSAATLPCETDQQVGALASPASPQAHALHLTTLKLEEIWKVLVEAFWLWVMPLTFGGFRRGGTRYILCLGWPLDCGWFMISRIKVSRTDCFPPACLEIFMFELNTQVMGYSVSQNCSVVYVKPEAFSCIQLSFQVTWVRVENFFLLPF